MRKHQVLDLDRDMTPGEFQSSLQKLGLLQVDAAKLLGTSVRTLRRYGRGHAAIPVPVVLALRLLVRHEYWIAV